MHAKRAARYLTRLMRHCWQQLAEDRAQEIAAALTFRTIFALVPLFVLGLVVFRMFGGLDDLHQEVQARVYEFFGVPEVSYASDTRPGDTVPVEVPSPDEAVQEGEQGDVRTEAPATEAERRQVRASIQKALTELTKKVSSLSFTSIGVVGVAVFLFAAFGLAVSVEYDFNIIYESPSGRSWQRRIPTYWSVATLGSALLALSLYLTGEFVDWLLQQGVAEALVWFISRILALAASWILLYFLYLLMPNTSVKRKPAAISSFIAAILWETSKIGFQAYLTTMPYAALYGVLGLIPLFLFWIYLSWLIVLFGLELCHTLQVLHGREPKDEDERPLKLHGDPLWLIPTLVQIGQTFAAGKSIGRQELADRLGLPSRLIDELARHLQEARLIHSLNAESNAHEITSRILPDLL